MKAIATAVILGALAIPAATFAADDASTSGTTSGKAKTAIKDSVITTKIKAEMVKDKTVSATHVKVDTTEQGVVTLSGKAKSQAEVDRAVAIAKGVNGVTEVKNNIEIATN